MFNRRVVGNHLKKAVSGVSGLQTRILPLHTRGLSQWKVSDRRVIFITQNCLSCILKLLKVEKRDFVNTEARWKWPIILHLKSGIKQVVEISLSFWLYMPEVTIYLVCVLRKTSPVLTDTSLCMQKTWFLFYTKIELPCMLYIFPIQHWHFLGLLSNSSMLMQLPWPFSG